MTDTVLITGANRGIGLEFVRQYAAAGDKVLACCRDPLQASALQAIAAQAPGQVELFALDVSDSAQICRLAQQLRGTTIDILINNAGIYGPEDARFGHTDEAEWLHTFQVNTLAPMKMMEAFVDHVAMSKRKRIVALSSKMGSMDDNRSGGSYIYRSSKAALNAVMKSAAIDLRAQGISAIILHPGWVMTDMGGPGAEMTVQASVSQLRQIIDQAGPVDSGRFIDVDGSTIPW